MDFNIIDIEGKKKKIAYETGQSQPLKLKSKGDLLLKFTPSVRRSFSLP